MRSPFQASAGKTGSEASERCALAPDTLADTALRSAPSARTQRPSCHRTPTWRIADDALRGTFGVGYEMAQGGRESV
jgi:hypothetical protein